MQNLEKNGKKEFKIYKTILFAPYSPEFNPDEYLNQDYPKRNANKIIFKKSKKS